MAHATRFQGPIKRPYICQNPLCETCNGDEELENTLRKFTKHVGKALRTLKVRSKSIKVRVTGAQYENMLHDAQRAAYGVCGSEPGIFGLKLEIDNTQQLPLLSDPS